MTNKGLTLILLCKMGYLIGILGKCELEILLTTQMARILAYVI